MSREKLFSITKRDFEIHWFSGSGAGGQHRNKHQNCCRLKHLESGATATGQSFRSRQANLREAFSGLLKDFKFKLWLNIRIKESLDGKTLKRKVEEMVKEGDLYIEAKDDKGRWVEWSKE